MKEENKQMADVMDKPFPLWLMVIMPFYAGGVLALFLFPFARNWRWFEAWMLVITFAINVTISNSIINKKNPRVLRNRMKLKKEGLTSDTRKSAGSDKFILPIMSLGLLGALILPALDQRFKWTSIHLLVEMIGLVIFNIGLILMNTAILQNAYASKLLDINKEQKLVNSGMYAYVRHPLYLGAIVMILAIPIALGSLWGIIPAVVATLSILIRIYFEEIMLEKGMEGYTDYKNQVRYKLIPKIY
ncbi:methyltransferase family protein [Patescibacteria group bacterium]